MEQVTSQTLSFPAQCFLGPGGICLAVFFLNSEPEVMSCKEYPVNNAIHGAKSNQTVKGIHITLCGRSTP
jgi:hypothetical protein